MTDPQSDRYAGMDPVLRERHLDAMAHLDILIESLRAASTWPDRQRARATFRKWFEVWDRGSLRHTLGLSRSDVLMTKKSATISSTSARDQGERGMRPSRILP